MFIEIQYLITSYVNRIIGHKFMYPKLIFYLIHWNLYPWISIKTQFMVFYMKCYVVWFLVTEKVWESESTDASDAEPPPVNKTPKPSSPQVGIWLYISPIQYYVTWKLHVKDVSLLLQPLKVVWVFFYWDVYRLMNYYIEKEMVENMSKYWKNHFEHRFYITFRRRRPHQRRSLPPQQAARNKPRYPPSLPRNRQSSSAPLSDLEFFCWLEHADHFSHIYL